VLAVFDCREQHLDDAGMVEPPQRLALALEALGDLGVALG
jgi:hypothetical protein